MTPCFCAVEASETSSPAQPFHITPGFTDLYHISPVISFPIWESNQSLFSCFLYGLIFLNIPLRTRPIETMPRDGDLGKNEVRNCDFFCNASGKGKALIMLEGEGEAPGDELRKIFVASSVCWIPAPVWIFCFWMLWQVLVYSDCN